MRDDPITRLAAANPVPHDDPLRALEAQGHGRRRRRIMLGVVVAAGVLAVVLGAAPARALVRDVLPFWDQPSAPPKVMVDFLALDWPGGPHANPANVRAIIQADLGGRNYTLYVAPAKNPAYGYCYEWSNSIKSFGGLGGGCTRPRRESDRGAMSFQPDLVHPHDASQLPTHNGWPIPPSGIHHLTEHAVVDFLTGEAWSPVDSVVIHFSDGTTAQPEITWVSAPINTGFWVDQVPNDKQSVTDHVTEVDAYDSNGNLIERSPQPLTPVAPPAGSATTGK